MSYINLNTLSLILIAYNVYTFSKTIEYSKVFKFKYANYALYIQIILVLVMLSSAGIVVMQPRYYKTNIVEFHNFLIAILFSTANFIHKKIL